MLSIKKGKCLTNNSSMMVENKVFQQAKIAENYHF